ncbi:CPBP family intramembrane metalloprotease [Caldibacillus lycopersici]|uniref:CPBP family intramembrane metalloprotease n=1 Tax=Perspicuibacillus lycopersici TaxID=1325689 RepID=A0AAE3IRT5_9BACI|nr:type II CAAX endopeptidase family protein [Perspicuibacillus lycopersici]MCU9612289.1 CPBP family intramembrane metalloprotease [Perspicuibacillus lycopersici]
MVKTIRNWKFLLGYLIAHLLLYFTFDHTNVFWYILTGSSFFLISYSIMNEEVDDKIPVGQYLLYGILSGLLLYGLFWLGNAIINGLNLSYFENQVQSLYKHFSPDLIWHYIVLVLVIIPAEEFFWRGFIQKRFLANTNFWTSILASAILYASVYIFSGYPILIVAALISGIVWGILYAWKRSLPLVVMSHLTFDLMIFLFLPLI